MIRFLFDFDREFIHFIFILKIAAKRGMWMERLPYPPSSFSDFALVRRDSCTAMIYLYNSSGKIFAVCQQIFNHFLGPAFGVDP